MRCCSGDRSLHSADPRFQERSSTQRLCVHDCMTKTSTHRHICAVFLPQLVHHRLANFCRKLPLESRGLHTKFFPERILDATVLILFEIGRFLVQNRPQRVARRVESTEGSGVQTENMLLRISMLPSAGVQVGLKSFPLLCSWAGNVHGPQGEVRLNDYPNRLSVVGELHVGKEAAVGGRVLQWREALRGWKEHSRLLPGRSPKTGGVIGMKKSGTSPTSTRLPQCDLHHHVFHGRRDHQVVWTTSSLRQLRRWGLIV